jgi:hypothetical protein
MATDLSLTNAALTVSGHAAVRMQQRGVTARMVRIALECGERAWSHGAVCHQVTERSLCGTPYATERDRLRGLCVVFGPDGMVITVKWDYRLCRPGPLRRANAERWREVQAAERHQPRPGVPSGASGFLMG